MSAPPTSLPEHPTTYLFSFHRATNRDELLRHAQRDRRFTDALVMPKVGADLDLVLLSFDGETFSFAGLFTSANRAVTGKRRGKFEMLEPLPAPLVVRTTLGRTKVRTKEIDATGQIEPTSVRDDVAKRLFDWMTERAPANISALDKLRRLREKMLASRSDPSYLTLSEQRDGIGLICDIAGLDRANILGSAALPSTEPPQSYVASLPGSNVPFDERQIIEHDMALFGNWTPKHPEYKGARVYSDGTTKVTLLCVDRSPIETTTGVDLIYHFDTFDSFVMVQYKRMSDGIYRPEARCHEQVNCMAQTHGRLVSESQPVSEKDFRLSSNPFYFKICEGAIPIEHNESLVEGMYFPIGQWQLILTDPSSRGPRDGVAISRKIAPRWLSNTEFIDIAKKGWIGTTQAAGRKWVRELVQQSLGGARSLILARLMRVETVKPE